MKIRENNFKPATLTDEFSATLRVEFCPLKSQISFLDKLVFMIQAVF